MQIQAHSEWCWAATGASVLDFLNLPQTQCAIVDYVRNITDACGNPEFNWTDPVANEAIQALYGPPPSVSDLMAHFGAPCTGQASALALIMLALMLPLLLLMTGMLGALFPALHATTMERELGTLETLRQRHTNR